MGADLYAENGTSGIISVNWGDLHSLLAVLDQLGADISSWPRFNDGEAVDSYTALSWGDLILDNLDRIGVIEYAETVPTLDADYKMTMVARREFVVVERGETAWLPEPERAWLLAAPSSYGRAAASGSGDP
jgi:hypothetical protein